MFITAVSRDDRALGVGIRRSTHDGWADCRAGARAMAPWLLGVVPFGLVIGVSAARADIPLAAGWLTAPLIYGGSAQVAAIELLHHGSAPVVVVIAVLAVNARLILYSASMSRRWNSAPRWWQALAAYLLVDPSFAVGAHAYETARDVRTAHRHYIGGAVVLWLAWLAAVTAGAFGGSRLPAGLHLEIVIPLFLAGEVATRVKTTATLLAVVAAAATAFVASGAPLHTAPLLAIAAGLAVALTKEKRS